MDIKKTRPSLVVTVLLIISMLFSGTVWAQDLEVDTTENTENPVITENTENPETDTLAGTDNELKSGSGGIAMDTTNEVYLTLAENTSFRWNANGSALKGNEIHLDYVDGENCHYKLFDAGQGFYGIKHIKSGGTDRFVDVDGNNNKENAVLHLWDDNDYNQGNRQFAFHSAGTDADGRQLYYIQVKGSGLWVGLENNQQPSQYVKLAQVKEENRKAWYVSTSTIPYGYKGGETRLYDTGKDDPNTIFNMSWFGHEKRNVNVHNDSALADGNCLQLFYIGTSSKIEAEYNAEYDAYVLRSRNLDNNPTGLIDYVWDVDNGLESGEGDILHIWTQKDNYPSQMWRFVKTDDGENTYKIYNLNSGLWITLDEEKDEDGVKLAQSKDATVWTLSFLNKDTDALGTNWMSQLPDDTPISTINIPGAHDAGASNIRADALPQESAGRAQQYYITEQLKTGVRAFDIRACSTIGSDKDPMIIHGGSLTECQREGDEKTLRLSDVMGYCEDFLDDHPTETIILCIAANRRLDMTGKDGYVADAVSKYLDEDYIWQGNATYGPDELPNLGDVRGKVILQRRYTFEGASDETLKIDPSAFGMDLTSWDSQDYSASPHVYEVGQSSSDGLNSQVWAQDYYKESSAGTKLNIFGDVADYVEKNAIQYKIENSVETRGLVYNYTTTSDSLDSARTTNAMIIDDSFPRDAKDSDNYFASHATVQKTMGIVMLNYLDYNLSKEVFMTNFLPKSSVSQVQFPENKLTLAYGQQLKEADLSTAIASLAGTFSFENGERVMDVLGEHTVKLTFTPENTQYSSITRDVTVVVVPRTVTLNWNGAEPRQYDGHPSNVTATAGNLLEGDVCTVNVEGGNETAPGTHTATAVSLSNPNYQLPDNVSIQYTINKAGETASNSPGTGIDDSGNPMLAAVIGMAALMGAAFFVLKKKA